jgi:heme exporter protein A
MEQHRPQTTADTPLAIDIARISKFYGATPALRDVDLQLPWGNALVLFGHNGAGKSTLLRALSTLVRPDRGTMRIAGFDRDRQASRIRAAIGYVGHDSLLYDDLTPVENLHFYARLYGLPNPTERIAEVLRDVGAVEWSGRRVRTLSNGMRKRIAIARALLHRPRVLLLDEPETGLDESGLELLDAVVRGVADGGASVVMTTHGTERGLAVADRVAVLSGGRMIVSCERSAISAAEVQDAITGRTGAV